MTYCNSVGGSTIKGRFYHELVTIKVEDTIHRVPKYHLETWSTVFKDMFSLPQGPAVEGSSEENPILLQGCTNAEFESLMDVLLTPSAIVPLVLPKEQWISVLKLSTMWEITRARNLSIEKLKAANIPPTEMITLGRRYKVTSLFVDGCAALASEDCGPEQLETLASTLGWDFSARLMNFARCLQCSAPLSILESSEPAHRTGPILPNHGPIPHPGAPAVTTFPQLAQIQPQMQIPPPPPQMMPSHPPLPGHLLPQQQPNTMSMPLQALQMMQQQLQQQQAQNLPNPHPNMVPQAMLKRTLVVKYTCPTPACRGVSSIDGLQLDMSAACGLGGLFSREDLSTAIEEIFEDEMKVMY